MATYGSSTYGTSTGYTASQIKNLALFELGFVDEIDFTDTTLPTVEKVNRIYDTVLSSALSAYPWRFIIKRKELEDQSTADDTQKYKYNYELPLTMLALENVYSDANYCSPIREYESTPTSLNTNSSTVYISYKSIIDEVAFPQYFIEYLRKRLARELCFNLTGDDGLFKQLVGEETLAFRVGKNTDAKQNPTRTIPNSPYTQIRR